MIKKNDVFDVEIIDVGFNFEGIAKKDGVVLFIPNALLGEKVKVKVINTKQKAYVCKVLEVLSPSSKRVEPLCPYFLQCGGCQSQHIDYFTSLQFKTKFVQDAITNIGKIKHVVDKCVESDKNYYYRNKLALPIHQSGKVGLFREYSHNILPIENCVIQEKWAKDLISCINDFIEKYKISVYDEINGTGLLRHVVARHYSNQYLFTIVINGKSLPNVNKLIEILSEKFKTFGLNININRDKTNLIMTDKFVKVYGLENIEIEEFGIIYNINNASFMQVNNDIKNKIYTQVLSEISKNDIVIDAYSGAGLLTAICSKVCKESYGIEIIKPAVLSADDLKVKNNITNMTNICGDSAKVLPKLLEKMDENTVVVLDPPRKGCDIKVIESIAKAEPKKLIYISCNPSTLARDLNNLLRFNENYKVKTITPYDMFPCTKHVETVAVLQLN